MIPHEFSSQSPSYQAMVYPNSPSPLIPNMVSERYRFPPRWRNLPPLFFVIFDPTSYLMTHSILRHLLKLANMEKRFSPLPPLCKPNAECSPLPPHDSDVNVEEESIAEFSLGFASNSAAAYSDLTASDSDVDGEEESYCDGDDKETTTSIQVLEYDTSRNRNSEFIFGNFRNSARLSLIPVTPFKLEIEGFTIKVGEITCFLRDPTVCNKRIVQDSMLIQDNPKFLTPSVLLEKDDLNLNLSNLIARENVCSLTKSEVVNDLEVNLFKHYDANFDNAIPKRIISIINQDLTSPFLKSKMCCLSIFSNVKAQESSIVSFMLIDESLFVFFNLHVIETIVFDPGGVFTKFYNFVAVLSISSRLISISSRVGVFIFDPGGNSRYSLLVAFVSLWLLVYFGSAKDKAKLHQVVLDLDETLICAYETSSLPAALRSQAIEAGINWFELECVIF